MGASRVSDYQPRPQGGWPAQPPQSSGGGQDRDGYGQPSYNQQGAYGPGYGSRGRVPRPRRRRRGWVVLIVFVVAILVIFGIADQVARTVAENQVAQKIETSGLNTKPSVGIEGWPFLTQLAAKDIKAIDINASNVKTGKFEISSIKARATGVHLSSLSANASARIDQINGTATITYQSLANDLGNAINLPGVSSIGSIAPDPSAGPDAVKVDLGGLASVDATVKQTSQNTITIHFGALSGLGALLGGSASIPDQVITIPKLPAGLVVRSVAVESQGIVATASATNTTLSQ
jgi:hypothetical protein